MRPTAGNAALRPAQNSSRSSSEVDTRKVVERHALAARDAVVDLFTAPETARSSLAGDTILPRLVRRYAAAGAADADAACLALLRAGAGS